MPRPSNQKRLAKAGHRDLTMDESTDPPNVIKKDDIALTAWHSAITQLQKQGTFQHCDLMVVERYAVSFSLVRKYEEMCAESEGIQTAKSGYRSLAAELSCFLKASTELRFLEKALGISVVARAEAGLTEEPEDDFSTWMKENG
jgi:phage terminase small subunit